MNNTQALNLLLQLDENELNNFKSYLSKKYRPKKLTNRIFLYYYNKRWLLETQSSVFDLPIVYKKICKVEIEKKGKKTFQNALSQLYKDTIDFLLTEEIRKDSFEKDLLLIRILQAKKQKKAVAKIISTRMQKLKAIHPEEQWQALQMLQLEEFTYFNNYEEKITATTSPLVNAMNLLDTFYTNSKLYYSCEMKNRANILTESYDISLLDEVQVYIEQAENNPLGQIYNLCLKLIQKEQESDYETLLEKLKNEVHTLSKKDQLIVFGYLENFLIRKIKAGEKESRKKLFNVHKLGLSKEIYVYNNYISGGQFNNIIQNACKLKKFTWARVNLRKYQEFLPDNMQEDWANLLLATIHFEEGSFQKAWDVLIDVNFQNDFFNLRGKALLLRCYYELNQPHEFITKFCNSFYTFIKEGKRKFNKDTLAHYLTLIKYVRHFIREKNRDPKALLIEKIKEEDYKLFNPWLLEKASLFKY